jgi:RNA polymerase sigma-70 factor (ECF subfamily)
MSFDLGRPPLDEATLEKMYVKLERPIFNVVYRWLWNAEDAHDVTQEAFMRVWRARASVDVATLEPLLYRTALNLASNKRRASKIWRFLGLETAVEIPADKAASDEALETERRRARVKEAIEALPDHLREVVLLAEYSELSYEEIGKMLKIPPGTVGSRRNTALARLAETLGPIEEP